MAVPAAARARLNGAIERTPRLACKLQNDTTVMRSLRTSALLACLAACSPAAAGCTRATGHTTSPAAATANAHGSHAEAAFERGRTLALRGDYLEAERALSAALEGGYAPARVLPALLDVCAASRRFRHAVDYATPYLQLHPGDFQLRYRIASALLELGEYERARTQLERVLETAPNFAPAHYLLAVTLRDHFREAREAAAHFSAYHRLSTRGTNGARSRDGRSLL